MSKHELGLTAAAVLFACATAPPPDERPLAPIPEPPAASSAEPRAPATASESPAPPDASAVQRPRTASSPGEIECFDVACDLATELCCINAHASGRCIPRTDPAGCGSVEALWKYCDESADCASGHVCCYSPRPDPTVYAQNICRKGDCSDPEYETCLAGGKCSRKRKCKLSHEQAYDGYCH